MKNDKTKKFVFALILIGLCTWLVCSVAFPNRATAYRTESGSPHEIAPGLNLFNSTKEPYAVLVNNSGIEKHRWELDSTNGKGWHHVEPSDDGH
ncbi:MAG: hypothetical protein KDD62_12230, partial [Bdellovibrionales bacterium]|nr:hypothetical protein [Bdellovibrionales bacterium]